VVYSRKYIQYANHRINAPLDAPSKLNRSVQKIKNEEGGALNEAQSAVFFSYLV